MKWAGRLTCIPAVTALAIAIPALAFEYPLSDTAIREAFLTGNGNNDRSTELFLKYSHSLPPPNDGPYVATIGIMTPYEQVAERGATVTNYHAQEAEQEFLGKPMSFLVRVQIHFTPTYPMYPAPGPDGAQSLLQPLPDYQNDFKIDVSQDKTILPRTTRAYITSSYFSYNTWGLSGLVIEQDYDPEKIDSSELTVEVHAPADQDIVATFDMAQIQ